MLSETGHIDRTRFPSGPWDNEPDKLSWTDETTGLPCLICRNQSGALCGYVGVPPTHKLHGLAYPKLNVQVHGGLTYSDSCDPAGYICHHPAPGEPDNIWWFGFDTAHAGDLVPTLLPYRTPSLLPLHETYKTISYVQQQTIQLAAQLHSYHNTIDEDPF